VFQRDPENAGLIQGEFVRLRNAVVIAVDPQPQFRPDGVLRIDEAVAALRGLVLDCQGQEAVGVGRGRLRGEIPEQLGEVCHLAPAVG